MTDYTAQAREWMQHSFPAAKLFDNRVESLARALTSAHAAGRAAGIGEAVNTVDAMHGKAGSWNKACVHIANTLSALATQEEKKP